MLGPRFLETLSTKHFLPAVAGVFVAVLAGFGGAVYLGAASIETLATFADAVLKAVAVLVGALWVLNRYYTQRTDVPQFKVDAEVGLVRQDGTSGQPDLALLVYRLDLVNTGRALIPPHRLVLEIDAVTAAEDGPHYEPLHRWPVEGDHIAGPIEPGSWGAINDAVVCPSSTSAVRIFLEVRVSETSQWTWHRTFDVSGTDNGQ